ncbi:hypothetical protein K523DRAFT_111901 [Schizophyllum commune Tattone D]|nr:hypothetical protein K523DRAFT_111901 [Schizophyllum commune Tattone D]
MSLPYPSARSMVENHGPDALRYRHPQIRRRNRSNTTPSSRPNRRRMHIRRPLWRKLTQRSSTRVSRTRRCNEHIRRRQVARVVALRGDEAASRLSCSRDIAKAPVLHAALDGGRGTIRRRSRHKAAKVIAGRGTAGLVDGVGDRGV